MQKIADQQSERYVGWPTRLPLDCVRHRAAGTISVRRRALRGPPPALKKGVGEDTRLGIRGNKNRPGCRLAPLECDPQIDRMDKILCNGHRLRCG
jgi:hypothetical protein